MITKSELIFYESSDFKAIKEHYKNLGKELITITKFIQDEQKIEDYSGDYTVLDISSFITLKDSQYHYERLLSLFDNTFTFIAIIKHRVFFEEELRFCFENFTVFETTTTTVQKSINVETIKKIKRIIDFEESDLTSFFEKFNSTLYGHEKFKNDFKDLVDDFRVFNKLGEHKILSIFLMGESGVGKTEVARAIHKALIGEQKMAKVNFGNYSSDNSLNSLIGSPRGYIGSEDGELFIRVEQSDTGVILIDEFEKSNSTLFNYFLDVLENGKMVSSLANEIDLNGYIIILTSNIKKEDFVKVISPELSSRFDYKGYFSVLTNSDKLKYLEFRIDSIIRKYSKHVNMVNTDIKNNIMAEIDVIKYSNMRDINKVIKRTFVKKLKE